MRLYDSTESRRRNGSLALLVFGLPFLYWISVKIVRLASGGPLFTETPGMSEAIITILFGLVAWNCWRIRAHPKDFVDFDRAAGVAREYKQGRKARTVPLAELGPLRMVERFHTTTKGTGHEEKTTSAGSSFAVGCVGMPGYDICDARSETRARRRMEATARELGLASVTLGGIERSADEINLSLVERVQRQGETLTAPVAPASTPITWRVSGDTLEIRSTHIAIVPLLIALGMIVIWISVVIPAWPYFREQSLVDGSWSWVGSAGLLASAVPILMLVAWQVRAGVFPGRVTVSPGGLRYRFAHVPLDAVEEIAAGRGEAPRLWTDRGPIVISNGFCPPNQYGYLAQLIRWAVVETASKRGASPH